VREEESYEVMVIILTPDAFIQELSEDVQY